MVAEAGVTKPTLYKYFPSKDDLVTVVVEFRSENWRQAIEELICNRRRR